ncbi:MAG: serine/threonine-protein phosphatase [Myxococcales bacterium]|nr:serine/threonine-protein phosphatase [Myxococcales bacterium]
MQIESAGLTDVGQRRKLNEDAFLVDDALALYVVADGMGGHAAGEVASSEAVDAVHSMVIRERAKLERLSQGAINEEVVRQAHRVLEAAVQNATYQVFGIAQHEPEQQGMGTTVSALALAGPYGITAQVGDSRIYLIRQGQARPLTEDHTLVAWQLKQGIITPEEALLSPHKNVITRAVGSREYVQVDTRFVDVQPNDAFMLCSDGLHGYVPDHEIPGIVALGPRLSVERFIQLANDRGGRDNITCVVVQLR